MLRGFTDAAGVEWRVWQVLPSTAVPVGASGENSDALARLSLSNTQFAHGWLCFESAHEKRRLAPIPAGWEFLDSVALASLCGSAVVVPSRTHRASGAA
jgi:hypothetical protein